MDALWRQALGAWNGVQDYKPYYLTDRVLACVYGEVLPPPLYRRHRSLPPPPPAASPG